MSTRAKAFLLLLVDLLILIFSLSLALWIRSPSLLTFDYISEQMGLYFWVFPFWILMIYIEGLYSFKHFKFRSSSIATSLLRVSVITMIISIIISYSLAPFIINVAPKTVLFLTGLITYPLIYSWRGVSFRLFSHSMRRKNTVVIGAGAASVFVSRELRTKPYLGFNLIKTSFPLPLNTEVVVIDSSSIKDDAYREIFSRLATGLEVIDLALFAEMISGKIPLEAIDEAWFIEYCGYKKSRSQDIIKTLFDKAVAITLMLILLPFFLVLLPILLIVHGRPLFYKQTRTGLYNKPFTLYKLRSMVLDAEKNGAQWASPKDARITPLGKFLRKTRLDELPQLINILKGEMSLVGPRPERPEIIDTVLAPNIAFYNLRHLARPGVTGWAQVIFRYGFSTEDSKEKLQYDLYYVKNKSFWLDVAIIFKTIKTVITGAGQ